MDARNLGNALGWVGSGCRSDRLVGFDDCFIVPFSLEIKSVPGHEVGVAVFHGGCVSNGDETMDEIYSLPSLNQVEGNANRLEKFGESGGVRDG